MPASEEEQEHQWDDTHQVQKKDCATLCEKKKIQEFRGKSNQNENTADEKDKLNVYEEIFLN